MNQVNICIYPYKVVFELWIGPRSFIFYKFVDFLDILSLVDRLQLLENEEGTRSIFVKTGHMLGDAFRTIDV